MPRRTVDVILSSIGALVAVVLIAAGGLLAWGYGFANGQVHDQLAAQKIYFPEAGSPALDSPEIGPYLDQYAGQQLVTGAQAEAYADHFIAVHLKDVAGGQTYAQVSAKAQADPNNTQLRNQAQTLFRGEALRGLLLDAYGFWKLGQIARYGAIVSFIAAGLMLMLTVLGFIHARRAPVGVDDRRAALAAANAA